MISVGYYRDILFCLAIMLTSCGVHKKMAESSPDQALSVTNPPVNHIYSAGAKLFIHDYRKSLDSNNDFPDSVLIEKYALEKIENSFYVGVQARVTSDFNPDQLIPLKAIKGSMINGILSLKIPAGNLEKLGAVMGIEYIDVGRKVLLKNGR